MDSLTWHPAKGPELSQVEQVPGMRLDFGPLSSGWMEPLEMVTGCCWDVTNDLVA